MLVEMENCRVLVSDQKIEQMKDIIPVLEQITRQNQPLLIVTEDITGTLCRLEPGHCICKVIYGSLLGQDEYGCMNISKSWILLSLCGDCKAELLHLLCS